MRRPALFSRHSRSSPSTRRAPRRAAAARSFPGLRAVRALVSRLQSAPGAARCGRRCGSMLWTLVVILFVLWASGLSLKIAGGLIHILLVIALIVILVRLLERTARLSAGHDVRARSRAACGRAGPRGRCASAWPARVARLQIVGAGAARRTATYPAPAQRHGPPACACRPARRAQPRPVCDRGRRTSSAPNPFLKLMTSRCRPASSGYAITTSRWAQRMLTTRPSRSWIACTS